MVIAWPSHVGPTHTPIVSWIAEEEAQIFGCDLNSKFPFINAKEFVAKKATVNLKD